MKNLIIILFLVLITSCASTKNFIFSEAKSITKNQILKLANDDRSVLEKDSINLAGIYSNDAIKKYLGTEFVKVCTEKGEAKFKTTVIETYLLWFPISKDSTKISFFYQKKKLN